MSNIVSIQNRVIKNQTKLKEAEALLVRLDSDLQNCQPQQVDSINHKRTKVKKDIEHLKFLLENDEKSNEQGIQSIKMRLSNKIEIVSLKIKTLEIQKQALEQELKELDSK